jgi:thiosulfate/3-mercaptopyruvate sulfurtransferase
MFSTATNRNKFLIETEDLASLISQKSDTLRIVNATWYMPNDPRNASKEHLEARLTKDTVYFDIDKVVQPGSDLPHTLPPVDVFTRSCKEMNVAVTDQIVCYDSLGMFSAPRVAWMFRFFGADNVRVLNGGLKKWLSEQRPTVGGDQVLRKASGSFDYKVRDSSKVIMNIGDVHNVAY